MKGSTRSSCLESQIRFKFSYTNAFNRYLGTNPSGKGDIRPKKSLYLSNENIDRLAKDIINSKCTIIILLGTLAHNIYNEMVIRNKVDINIKIYNFKYPRNNNKSQLMESLSNLFKIV